MPAADEPVTLDPFAHWFHANPFPTYARLRETEPVYHNAEMGFYALTRFADVFDAFGDPATYSSAQGISLETIVAGTGGSTTLIEEDPPEHTRERKLVSRMFTQRRIARIEDDVRRVVRRAVDAFGDRDEIDFVGDFSGPVPMDVISEILAVPAEHRDRLRHLADLVVAREEGTLEVPAHTITAYTEIMSFFRDRLDDYRRPGTDGLIAELCARQRDHIPGVDAATDDEIVGLCFLFIIAGHETTTKMLANAVDLLERHPDQRAALVADPALVPRAVEEVMRFNNSSQYMARTLRRDVTLHGVTMPAGSPVLLVIGAANRDPREFDDPDRFDIHRDIRRSLAFGRGAHFCLGAHLARLEGRVALEEFLARAPEYEVIRDRATRIHAGNVMGWASLPLRLAPTSDRGERR